MSEVKSQNLPDQKDTGHYRWVFPLVGAVSVLCLVAAIWIGRDYHWAGLAWIPIGVLVGIVLTLHVLVTLAVMSGRLHAHTSDAKGAQLLDKHRWIPPFIRSVRLLCLIAVIWIGFDYHWAGLAWIPIAVLLTLAIVGNLIGWICAFLIRLHVIFQAYRIARGFRYMSAAQRDDMLTRMPPTLRKIVLFWSRNHVA